jgi:hypothetical protein
LKLDDLKEKMGVYVKEEKNYLLELKIGQVSTPQLFPE